MVTLRICLVIFVLVLATAPFASVYFIKENNRRFEEAERAYYLKYGTTDGLYGDCSGVSILLPIAVMFYTAGFGIWSLLLAIIAGTFSRQAVLVQTILIGALGVFPATLWLLLVFTR